MNSLTKISLRYVGTAAAVAFILLVLNFVFFIAFSIYSATADDLQLSYRQRAETLSNALVLDAQGNYQIAPDEAEALENTYVFGMLIGNDGNILWQDRLPEEIPTHYSLTDIASLSRWYLEDYPVAVWTRPDGLLVFGQEKDSVWKYSVKYSMSLLNQLPYWLIAALVFNAFLAILLALIFGYRLYRSVRPVTLAIEALSDKTPLNLPTSGILGNLSEKLNAASETLSEQYQVLNRRDTARTEWIAGVSHDIRTPLSLTTGYSAQLAEDPTLTPEQQEKARIIHSQSLRIRDLVDNLNLASKLTYRMQPLNLTPCHLSAILREVAVNLLNSGLPDTYTIDSHISKEAEAFVLSGDKALLTRALSNLTNNSVRHNPEGCAICLTLAVHEGKLVLTVSDNGSGYPAEILAQLKHPKDTQPLREHSLGLMITRQIAIVHGGFATFANSPAGGAQTTLVFPGDPSTHVAS